MTRRLAFIGCLLALAALAAGCGGGGDHSVAPGKAVRIDVTVAGDTITAPSEPKVAEGSDVEIHVTADVAEEVHVHGYDLHADVAPGHPAVIRFTANVPGVFEVELEHSGRLLFRFEVS